MFHDGVVRRFTPALLLVTFLLTGCVERKLSIRTEPSGARAYMDYDLKGTTPVQIDFTHYGSRFVRLEKNGYRTQLATIDLDPPWHSYFPVNFFTEVLYPFTITDHRERVYELEGDVLPSDREPSQGKVDRKEVQERAEQFRKQSPGSSTSADD